MALPDVIINVLSAVTPRALPTETGTAFVVGTAQRGAGPRLLRSLNDFTQQFGVRQTTSTLYDWLDTFFHEGGTTAWCARAIHSDAEPAKYELKHSAEISLVVKAGSKGETDPGTWGNELKVAVVASGSGYALVIEYEGKVVEESVPCVTQADAVAWATKFSNYVVVSLGAGTLAPDVTAAKALSGGTAGTTVADVDYETALTKFPRTLGPGQVALPGQTTAARQLLALAHAVARNRFAILDAADTATSATLVAAAQALYTAPSNGRRYGQLCAPWDIIPGLVANTTRTVPPSARLCGQCARVDALGNPNEAAAGARRGLAQYVIDLSQPSWTEQQRLELNNAGVTISRRRYGSDIATWGARTLADQNADAQWSFAPGLRTIMAYVAEAAVIGDEAEFEQVDGFGHEQAKLKGQLVGLASKYFNLGALYGREPAEAFSVNTGESVNTPQTLSEGKLIAQVGLRVSPVAEQVVLNIVKVPITEALA